MPNEAAKIAGYPVGLDAYTAAFTVPDFMFTILVSGALSVTFIPVFNQRLVKGNKKSAWELSTSMINFMAIITLIASVLIIIFAEPILKYLIAPGLSESGLALATSMMRVIAVNPFLFAIATVIASMQQAVGRFTFFALAPAIYSIGIIIGTVFFTNGINIFGWQMFEGGIMGVALGVVLGSIMQLLVSSIGLLGLGFDYRFKIFWKNKGFMKVLSLLPARSADQGMDYVVSLAETNLASRMVEGTIRAYQQASMLHLMPINLIGVAISNAAFPQMTERIAQGRPDLFKKELQKVIRVIVWLILPVATVAFFARGYVVHFVKNGGDHLIATLLGFLVIAIVFRSIYHIAARSFYAEQDTKTPLYVSIFAILLNVGLAVWFTLVLDFGAYGLAWAQSIVAVLEVAVLFVFMARRIPGLFDVPFIHGVARMVAASILTAVVSYFSVQMFQLTSDNQSFFATFPKFALIVSISFSAYIGFSRLLGLQEVMPVFARMKKILFSSPRS
jgi:putative peptidoglycan lipid II flippase